MASTAKYRSPAARAFDAMLTADVRPFLRSRGFAKSGATFRRSRGPLYDTVNFQGNRYNGVTPWHAFFVNVGIGSAELESACPGHDRELHRAAGPLVWQRWESMVPGLPAEPRFDETTDMKAFAADICAGLARLLAEIEKRTTTAHLISPTIARAGLGGYERTCCYLAATGQIETLLDYTGALSSRFGGQPRWPRIAERITAAVGERASALRERGIPLDATAGS